MIKSLIDECDYYILIIAGRYGSVEPASGKSYSQKEFEYAKSKGIPTISFIHEHPEELPDKYTEKEHKEELNQFREIAKNSLVCHWNTKGDLTKDVVLSLIGEFKTHPRIGWMRADEKPSNEQNKELLRLKEENEKLTERIKTLEETAPEGTDDLCQGEDEFNIQITAIIDHNYEESFEYKMSWNDICRAILPHLVQFCWEYNMSTSLKEFIESREPQYRRVHINDLSFQTIKVQLIALGLITEAPKVKTSKTLAAAWTLTKYGALTMMRLGAIRRNIKEESF